jgi:hypothetical protein
MIKDIRENTLGSFECACHERDHVIKAHHWNWGSEGHNKKIHEVDFTFIMYTSCWEANEDYYGKDNWVKEKWLDFTNFFRRIKWRINKASKLLFTGSMRFEGDWMATEEGFEDLRKWMNKTAKLLKKDNGKIIG